MPPLPGTPPPLFKILASVSTALVRESVFRDMTRYVLARVTLVRESVLARYRTYNSEEFTLPLVRERKVARMKLPYWCVREEELDVCSVARLQKGLESAWREQKRAIICVKYRAR